MSRRRVIGLLAAPLILSACATTSYASSCAELTAVQGSALRKMVREAARADFRRHVVMIETGSEISDSCQTHYIDAAAFSSLPGSARPLCAVQAGGQDKYCLIYSVDGRVVKQPVP